MLTVLNVQEALGSLSARVAPRVLQYGAKGIEGTNQSEHGAHQSRQLRLSSLIG